MRQGFFVTGLDSRDLLVAPAVDVTVVRPLFSGASAAFRALLILLGVILASVAGVSKAAADNYSLDGWAGNSISYGGNGLPSATLRGQVNCVCSEAFTIENTSSFAKTYQFSWSYLTSDTSGKPIYDPAKAYVAYSSFPLIDTSGSASQSGTKSVAVPAGQTLTFKLGSDAADGTAVFSVTVQSVTGLVDLTVESASTVLSRNVAASIQPVRASKVSAPTFLVAPALPAGLTLNASSGVISGTPSAVSPRTTYTMTVNDGEAVGSATFQLEVNNAVVATVASSRITITTNTPVSYVPITAFGGVAPLTFSISPALPAGLSLAPATGVISGSATTFLNVTAYTVSVTDGTTTSSGIFTLTITQLGGATVSPMVINGTVGVALSLDFISSGFNIFDSSYSYLRRRSDNYQPGNFSLNFAKFNWPNPVAGTYDFPVTFDGGDGDTYHSFNITLVITSQPVPQTISFTSIAPAAVSGGAAYTPTATSTSNLAVALSIDATSAQVCSLSSGVVSFRLPGSCVINADQAGNDSYTAATRVQQVVNVAAGSGGATAQTLSFTSSAPTPSAGGNAYTPAVAVSSGLPATIRVDAASKAVCWVDGASVVFFTAGSCVISAEQAGNATYAAATPVPQTITVVAAVSATQAVASKTLALNTLATPFTPVTASGGASPLAYAISPTLPAGLSFSTSTGAISGTPSALSAAATYTVTITDPNASTASATFSLAVTDGPAASVAIASKGLSVNVAAVSFTPVTGAGGTGALTYTVSPALPAGLTLNSGTGAITGTPSAVTASASYAITVTDTTSRTSSASFTLAVNGAVAATQAVAATVLTANKAAVAFTPVTGSGGTSPLTFSVAPTLPAGLTLASSTGEISGTPTAASPLASYTVTVTDANNTTATASFNLTVSGAVAATQAVATKGLTAQTAAVSFTPVTGSGGTGTLAYTVSPALPTGLSLAIATGAITGTPTAASAAAPYTVTVTDANSATATASFTLTVSPALVATQAIATKVLSYNIAVAPFTPVTGAGGAGTLAYSISPTLPAGLSLSSSTGAISGTPTAASVAATYTVTVTDANSATATATVSITVNGPVTATQAIATKTLSINTAATPFTPVTGSGGTGALVYSIAPTLPAGLVISSSTGAISGTPTAQTAAATYTVTVTDANNTTATATFSLTVGTISTSVLLTASNAAPTFGQPVTLTATVTPGAATGTIIFKDGDAALGPPVAVVGGVATFTTSALTVGAHSLKAFYSGDVLYSASASGVVSVSPSRPNPASDPTVTAIMGAQISSARQAAQSAVTSVGQRMETLHDDNTPAFSNGIGVSTPSDIPNAAQAYGALTDPWKRREGSAIGAVDKFAAPKHGPTSAKDASGDRPPFNIWTSGSLVYSRNSGTDPASKFKFSLSGISAGLDTSVLPDLKAGFAIGLSADSTTIGPQGSKVASQSMTGSVYASWRVWDRFFLDGMTGYGAARSTTTRMDSNSGSSLSGQRPGSMIFGSLTASYDEKFGALKISPYARLDAVRIALSSYAEDGAPDWALAFGQTSLMSYGGAVGLRAQYGFDMSWGTLTPKGRLEYMRTSDGGFAQPIGYASDPSAVFVYSQKGMQRATTNVGLGLQATTRAGTSTSVDYFASRSAAGVQSQGMRGSVNVPF